MKPAKFTPVVVAPVTFETVRERLSYLEGLNAKGAGTAVKSQQFEIACLRELLVRLESRTVTVKLSKDHVDDADLFGWEVVVVPLEALKDACANAGVTVEIADDGIKVEAE